MKTILIITILSSPTPAVTLHDFDSFSDCRRAARIILSSASSEKKDISTSCLETNSTEFTLNKKHSIIMKKNELRELHENYGDFKPSFTDMLKVKYLLFMGIKGHELEEKIYSKSNQSNKSQ